MKSIKKLPMPLPCANLLAASLLLLQILVLNVLASFSNIHAEENNWLSNHTIQGYFQDYNQSVFRKNSFHTAYFYNTDYLDTTQLGLGYLYTYVNQANKASITEQLGYLTAQTNLYPDALPGKLNLRFDYYTGDANSEYRSSSPPYHFISEKNNIRITYLHLGFIDYKKTYYTDLGYSQYRDSIVTRTRQFTPTLAFGWNNSYDWLQFRLYVIDLQQQTGIYDENNYFSIESKYTHWIRNQSESNIEFVRFTWLTGDRLLATDPDTSSVYTNPDIQKSSLSGQIKWKLSSTVNALAHVQYDKYHSDSFKSDYQSYLFYFNLQFQQP